MILMIICNYSYNAGAARLRFGFAELRRAATLRVHFVAASRSLFAHTFSRFAAFGTALRAALRIASPCAPLDGVNCQVIIFIFFRRCLKHRLRGLRRLWREAYRYKKARLRYNLSTYLSIGAPTKRLAPKNTAKIGLIFLFLFCSAYKIETVKINLRFIC
jgi:hypothetical protein